jgi:EAL domain-containing protein (putative c-di-GMP-specific phosphodiesterase class I)
LLRLNASCGVALFPQHGLSEDELLAAADLSMYAATEQGGDQVVLYQPEAAWRDSAGLAVGWAERLRRALAEDRLVAYAQPILDLRRGEVTQWEFLVRLVEGQEVIAPAAFLAAAERAHLIQQVDVWICRQALRFGAREGRRVHVNLSPRTLEDDQAMEAILAEVDRHRQARTGLVVEVTETAAIANVTETLGRVHVLRSRGCQLALDDFGVGFSSLYYLRHLPVDYLKIDASFVRGLATDPQDRQIVRAIAELARGLGRATVAEGVEDAANLGGGPRPGRRLRARVLHRPARAAHSLVRCCLLRNARVHRPLPRVPGAGSNSSRESPTCEARARRQATALRRWWNRSLAGGRRNVPTGHARRAPLSRRWAVALGMLSGSRRVTVAALLVASLIGPARSAHGALATVTDVSVRDFATKVHVVVVATRAVPYRLVRWSGKPETWIVLDVPGAKLGMPAGELPYRTPDVARVRVGQFNPTTVRVVVELTAERPYTVRRVAGAYAVAIVVTASGSKGGTAWAQPVRPEAARFTLEFRDARLSDVMVALARLAKVNVIVASEAAKRRITIRLVNVSLEEALDLLTQPLGLVWTRVGRNIVVVPASQLPRERQQIP